MSMNYQDYSVQEFIEDSYFRQWVYRPDSTSHQFWQRWLAQHPEKQSEVDQAQSILLEVQFKEYTVSEEEKNEVWQQIRQQRLVSLSPTTQTTSLPNASLSKRWPLAIGIAASLVLLVVAYLGWGRSTETVYTAEYGTTRTILLADQSTVELNANSILRVSKDWDEEREVWLEGEGFFAIQHQEDATGERIPFIVHTHELSVRVVGTEFNVLSRRGETQVGLHSGKVYLNLDHETSSLTMQPGDWVAFSEEDQQLTQDQLTPASYTAWRDQRFWFDNHTLSEIASMIHDYYGLEVILSSPSLGQRTFSGQFPTDRLDLMLKAIQATLAVQVTITDQTIRVTTQEE